MSAQEESTTMSELGIVMPSRYQLTDKLSPDSIYAYYGVDNVRHKEVAMKIYGNLFAKNMELIKSVWSELFITRMICLDGSHPNIVRCLEFVKAPHFDSNFNYAAIVYELMDADLHFALQYNKLNIHQARYCLLNCLNAIYYLHERKLVHQGINSKTVLVNSNFDVKIANFRHCCFMDELSKVSKTYMTANVKSYRAPEILLQDFDEISYPVDIFAAGCLFAEIILGKPLFGAKHYIEQLEMIAKLIGIPEVLDLKGASELAVKCVQRIRTSNLYKQDTFAETFPSLKEFPDVLDLLMKMLAFKPQERISVKEAIDHPFFDPIRSKFFVNCGNASPFRHTGFNVDTYFENVLLMKNLIYNELFLGKDLESTIFENMEQVNQDMQEFSDVEIITTGPPPP